MWRSAARSIGACLALLCFFAVSSADPSPPSRADVTSGVRVAQRLIDTIPSPWRLDGDVRMAGDDAPVAQGNFVQASYALNKASLDSVATSSRAGDAMQFDSSGYLTYGPNNLLTYSNTFSNPAWTKLNASVTSGAADPLGGTNGWTITDAAGSATHIVYQALTFSGLPYAAVYMKAGTLNYGMLRLGGSSGASIRVNLTNGAVTTIEGTDLAASGATSIGNGWYLVWVKGTSSADNIPQFGPNDGTLSTTYTGSGTGTILAYAANGSQITYETTPRAQDQVITTSAAYYGPRFDYTYNGSSWVPEGLLVEGAATNLYPQSSSLINAATTTSGVFRSTDGTLAPDGVSLMAKLLAGANSGSHEAYNLTVFTVTAAGTYSGSVYVKKGNHRYVFVTVETNGGAIAVFDLDNPSAATQTWAVGTGSYLSSRIDNVGGGVYRISVTGTVGSITSAYLVYGMAAAATGNSTANLDPVWTPAGTEYTYFFGAQFEAGNLSSYTPTGASAVTRAADGVTFTGYTSNPFAILSAPESTGSYACNKYASQAAAISGVASPNQWVKSVKVWPVGTPSASQSC